MKLQRVVGMSVAELSCRARQEISKWLDRRVDPGRATTGPGVPGELIDRCLTDMPGRFFPGATDPRVPATLRDRFPESVRRIIATADQIGEKRFDLLGYRHLFFGDPIDWHLDPVARRRTPLAHWTRLDPLDAAKVGDSKVVWELNRQQWMVRLGQAYRLTGDERYANAFAGAFRAWTQANPPGMGINWSSSLEVAFRLISWCWTLALFRESPALTGSLRRAIVEGIAGHAARIERYLSHYFSPNTHLTGEALGLVYAGTLFPFLPAASRWRQVAAQILVRESERQILPDGVYMEQSTCYQRYTIEIYLHLLILFSRNGMPVPAGVTGRVQALVDALVTLLGPDRSVPQIGDADGGSLLPLEPRPAWDGSGVFAVAAAVLGRGEHAWAAGGVAPEVAWLLGADGVEGFARLGSRPPEPASRLLAEGGYAVMRSGWDDRGDQVIFDVGPLGCHVSGGHGHADLLSIQCSFRGQPYVVDPGTFRYTADEGWRSYYRSTAAHSTVEIDGLGQALPSGPFGWITRPRARLIRWVSTPKRDTATAEHRAYGRLADPVTHRRTVLFEKPWCCVIVDDVEGGGEHRISLRFQFAPMAVTVDPRGWVRAGRTEDEGLLLTAFSTSPLKATVVEGEFDPRQGWVSPAYGDHQPAPMLVYSVTAAVPLRIITLLLPTGNLSAPPPSVAPLHADGRLRGLVFPDGRELLWADDDVPAPPRSG